MSDTNGNGNGNKPDGNNGMSSPETRLTLQSDITDAKITRFLLDLKTNGGVSTHACKSSGLSVSRAYELANENPGFQKAWEESLQFAHDALITEAVRRGTKGEIKYVAGKGKRSRRRAIRVKSDKLLLAMIERGDKRRAKKRIIQAGNMALEAVREEGTVVGLTEEQIRAIQRRIVEKFDKIRFDV